MSLDNLLTVCVAALVGRMEIGMKFNLSDKRSYKKTVLLLFISSLAFSALTILFGELVLPLGAAALGMLMLVEEKKRPLSSVAAAVAVALSFIPGSFPSSLGIGLVLCALALFLAGKAFITKCDTAIVLTTIVSCVMIFSVFFFVFKITGDYSFNAALNHMEHFYLEFRQELAEQMIISYSAIPEIRELALTEDVVLKLIDEIMNYTISLVLVAAFFISGVTLKLFTLIMSWLHDKPSAIKEWRFVTPSVFAYFYIALFLASSLVMGDGIVEIAILNLSNLFMFVYAYVGLKSVYAMLRSKKSAVFSSVVLTVALFTFFGFALNVLSVVGVVSTVRYNKSQAGNSGTGNDFTGV